MKNDPEGFSLLKNDPKHSPNSRAIINTDFFKYEIYPFIWNIGITNT